MKRQEEVSPIIRYGGQGVRGWLQAAAKAMAMALGPRLSSQLDEDVLS